MKNKQIDYEEQMEKRWKELCKFHAGKQLAIELYTSLLWLKFVETEFPELYEKTIEMFNDEKSNNIKN